MLAQEVLPSWDHLLRFLTKHSPRDIRAEETALHITTTFSLKADTHTQKTHMQTECGLRPELKCVVNVTSQADRAQLLVKRPVLGPTKCQLVPPEVGASPGL